MWLLSHPWSIHISTLGARCSGPPLDFHISMFQCAVYHGPIRNPKASMTGAMCWMRLDDLRQCELRLSLRSNASYDCPHDQLLLPCEDRFDSFSLNVIGDRKKRSGDSNQLVFVKMNRTGTKIPKILQRLTRVVSCEHKIAPDTNACRCLSPSVSK